MNKFHFGKYSLKTAQTNTKLAEKELSVIYGAKYPYCICIYKTVSIIQANRLFFVIDVLTNSSLHQFPNFN